MNHWLEFLASQTISPVTEQNHISALPNLGLLYVGGDDAEDFLQNQLSNDISHIDENTSQLSSASTSKGRMFGIFRIIAIDGGYLLLMPKSILADVHQRLHKFILRAQVVMADISDSFARIALSTNKPELLDDKIRPTEVNDVIQSDSLICVHLHGFEDNQRYLLLSNDETEAKQLWQSSAGTLDINDESAWLYDEIRAAVPALYTKTQEAFVLQMANLDLLDGVNFKKGCYPGQEIVARTRYLGKVKRRMFLAALDGDTCPAPGDELSVKPDGGSDGSGKVVAAVRGPDNRCLMLFVALIDKAESGSLRLVDRMDESLNLLPLPYSLNNDT